MLKSLIVLIVLTAIVPAYTFAQELSEPLTKLTKLSFINPGIEWQIPTSANTLLVSNLGIGYHGSYPWLTTGFQSGPSILIAPFLDVQSRYYRGRERRQERNKTIRNNSGSFIVARFLLRGPSMVSSFTRTSEIDMAFGIGYGFQKSKNKLNFSFTVAPYFYFDEKGNYGFFPLIPEISLGYNISRKSTSLK